MLIAYSYLGFINNTDIVTDTYLDLFIGIFFCYLAPFFYKIMPSLTICGIRCSAVGIALSTCFSPILVRIIKIYTIFT